MVVNPELGCFNIIRQQGKMSDLIIRHVLKKSVWVKLISVCSKSLGLPLKVLMRHVVE